MRRSATDTKATILAAARERFARDGYERTTIRAVAADARIDPSMVMRYYGNKANLFSAAASFDLRLPDLTAIGKSRVGPTLAAHFLQRWEDDESLMLLLRTAVTNADAADRMREIFAVQVAPVAIELAGDRKVGQRRAGLVASQILGMALCRYVLEFPSVTAMPTDEVVEQIGPVLQRYLTRG